MAEPIVERWLTPPKPRMSRADRRDHRDPREGERRWNAARTNRLNEATWAHAGDGSLNQDLSMFGSTLRIRSTYEAANHAVVDGVINTHATDVVGEDGPTLSIHVPGVNRRKPSEDREAKRSAAWALAVERAWEFWAEAPEITGQMTFADLLELTIRDEWTAGEFFIQRVKLPFTTDSRGPTLRLHPIHPRRVQWSPWGGTATPGATITAGVEHDQWGKALRYWIAPAVDDIRFGAAMTPKPYDAATIIHSFRVREAGQLRGVPILSVCLEQIAELREYDTVTLDAARTAAMFAVMLHTEHPDIEPVIVNDRHPIKRGQMATLPPGYKPTAVAPNHPTAQYVDSRAERQRDIGLPVGMPGMMVRLDASGHNMSSARFDARVYDRSNRKIQRHRERKLLTPILRELVDEFRLLAVANRLDPRLSEDDRRALMQAPPANWYPEWIWTPLPQPDPNKEADADGKRLDQRVTTRADVCARMSTNWETVEEQLDREEREAMALAFERIRAAHELCANEPELGVTWRDLITLNAAKKQPGAVLQAGIAAAAAQSKSDDDDKPAGRHAHRLNGVH